MSLHVRVSIAVYFQLYKLTSQVSLHSKISCFICPLSWTSTFFIVNAFKFIIFFNLLTFIKTFNQGSWLAVGQWCHTQTQDQSLSWQRKLMISIMVSVKPDWSGLVCQLETNPVTQNLFIYHHGTGSWLLVYHYTGCCSLVLVHLNNRSCVSIQRCEFNLNITKHLRIKHCFHPTSQREQIVLIS